MLVFIWNKNTQRLSNKINNVVRGQRLGEQIPQILSLWGKTEKKSECKKLIKRNTF